MLSSLGHPAWVPEAINAVSRDALKIGKILFMGHFPLGSLAFTGGGGRDQCPTILIAYSV
jgi:hypothetical protein